MAYESLPGAVDRAALASKFSTYKPGKITHTDPNQVFQIPVGWSVPQSRSLEEIKASRDQMFAALSTSNVRSDPMAAVAARQMAMPPAEAKEGGGLFDIPVLGKILDAVDSPRAAIVSTIQEISDVFTDGDASLSDWWSQTRDHISAGEVLRDWGVDLPGPLDFVVGFGLDVALDPLTYLAGAGLAARFANVDKVADGLRLATTSGKTGKASVQAMGNAENIVRTKGVLAAVRAEPAAMQAIGIERGLRFTVPGTGRLGRRIIERPLSSVSPKFADRMARNRVRGLQGVDDGAVVGSAQFITDPLPFDGAVHRRFDLTNPNNAELVVQRLQGKGGFATGQTGVKKTAAFAARMPASVRVPDALGGGLAGDLLGAISGGVGGAYSRAMARGFLDPISGRINSQHSLNKHIRGDNADMAALARGVKRAGARGGVTATRWEKTALDDLGKLITDFKATGLDNKYFDELMFRVATTDPANLAASNLGRWAPVAAGGDEGLEALAVSARKWWADAGESANKSTKSINMNLQESAYAARMRDDILQGDRGQASKNGILIAFEETPISGNPMMQRKLHDAGVARERMIKAEQNFLAAPTGSALEVDVQRIRRIVDEANDPNVTFETVLDRELAVGARYGDGEITNIYMGEAIVDPKTVNNKNVLDQMDDIDARVGPAPKGKKGKQYSFSQNADQVLPRYVAVMKGNIRSRAILDIIQEEGRNLPTGALKQGDVAREIVLLEQTMKATADDLSRAYDDLTSMNPNQSAVANVLADMLAERGILPSQIAEFVKTPEGQLYGSLAELNHEIGTLTEVLEASAKGTPIANLSTDALQLIAPKGTLTHDGIDWLSASKQRQLSKARDDRTAALGAIQEATDYIFEMSQHLGRLQDTRNAIGAVIKQIDISDTAATKANLDLLATDLETSQQILRQLAQNMTDTYRVSDPTVVAAMGLKSLGLDAAGVSARQTLRETAKEMGKTAKGLRELGDQLKFLPDNGQFVQLSADGKNVRIRSRTQPLKGRRVKNPDDTLKQLLGDKGRTGLRQVAATMDNSPESLAQLKVLENSINLGVLESKLGTFITAPDTFAAIDNALDDMVALRQIVADQTHNQYQTALDGALDAAWAGGRKTPAMRAKLDEMAAVKTQIDDSVTATTERIEQISQNVKNVNERNTAVSAAIIELKAEVYRLSETAWDFGTPLPKGLDTVDRLRMADDPMEAYNAVRSAQGLKTVAAVYTGQMPQTITNMFRTYSPDFFKEVNPSVGSLTKSKLQGTSFVAPLDSTMTPADVEELAKGFAEMFQAVARTVDPEAMSGFLQNFARFNNWWKAQAVGTPGFVTRNLMGAAWMNNQLAGVPLSTMGRVRNIRKAAFEAGDGDIAAGLKVLLASKDDLSIRGGAMVGGSHVPKSELRVFEDWYTSGIASGTGGRGIDVSSQLDSPGVVQETKGFSTGFKSGTLAPGADFKPFAGIRGWNSDVEFAARGSLAHHSMMAGETIEDAAGLVTKYHFDYSDLTPFERKAKQVIPFWTWQRRALPVLLESIGRQPTAWGRIVQLKGELELNSPTEGVVPDYFGENMGIRLPFETNGFRTYMLPSLPFQDVANWAKGLDREGDGFDLTEAPFELGRPLFESALPSYKFPVEFLMKTRSFNQVPLNDTFEEAPNWAKIPVMRQALLAAGLAEEATNGDLMMTDTKIYQVEQFVPFFANVSRALPQSDPKWKQSDTAKQITTILNMTIGAGLQPNTTKTKRNQILREMYQRSDDMKNRRALNLRP